MGAIEKFDEQRSCPVEWKKTRRGKGRVAERSSGKQSGANNVPKLTAVSHT